MKKGKWKSKEDEYRIILKDLALSRPPLRKPDLEKPGTADSIPHASLIQRLKELKNAGSVGESNSGEKSKRKLPIKEYSITIYGFSKLLSLFKGKDFENDIFDIIGDFFTMIWYEIDKLKLAFSREQLFDVLATVCYNTSITIDYNPRDGETIHTRGITADLLLKKVKWVHYHRFEIKVQQLDSTYIVEKEFLISDTKRTRKSINAKTESVYLEFVKLIHSAFFHELLIRCQDLNFPGYPGKENIRKYVMEILRTNKILNEYYVNFLKYIKSQQDRQREIISEITHSIARKKPLVKFRKK